MRSRDSLRGAENKRYSAIDGRTTTWEGYGVSQRRRKIVEELFGWMKTVGGLRNLRPRGEEKTRTVFTLTATAYNLSRLGNLEARPCPARDQGENHGPTGPAYISAARTATTEDAQVRPSPVN